MDSNSSCLQCLQVWFGWLLDPSLASWHVVFLTIWFSENDLSCKRRRRDEHQKIQNPALILLLLSYVTLNKWRPPQEFSGNGNTPVSVGCPCNQTEGCVQSACQTEAMQMFTSIHVLWVLVSKFTPCKIRYLEMVPSLILTNWIWNRHYGVLKFWKQF